jgi:Aspartyl protease
MLLTVIAILTAAASAPAPRQDPKELYEQHRWAELRVGLGKEVPPFYRGAVANAFNDVRAAERLLRGVIDADPRSEQASEAYKLLARLYLRTGRYAALAADVQAWGRAFPDAPAFLKERDELSQFGGLPDQVTIARARSVFSHDGSTFVPVSIQGGSASYFFDTGAWLSCLSESEAKRLGLAIREGHGTLGNSSGGSVGFRTATAREVRVGKVRLRDVSFAVFPDDQEPWSQLPPGRRGILGIPILLAARTLRWAKNGILEMAGELPRPETADPNLVFDDNRLLLGIRVGGAPAFVTLDTGAETTALYGQFASEFPELVAGAPRDSTELRGVGHAETFDSVSVPEVVFELGGSRAFLKPAHVILRDMGARGCVGNLGLDLLHQGRAFSMDLSAMTLVLEKP